VPSTVWGPEQAKNFDTTSGAMFDPDLVEQTTGVLAELAGGGGALELAAGTGRIALPLAGRGIKVAGIELSPHMAEQFRSKAGSDGVDLVVGDMTSTRVAGTFQLVYLLWNTIMNVTTQDEQTAVFENAAAHLVSGGCFLVEVRVPDPPDPDGPGRVAAMTDGHVCIDTLDDPIGQITSSHHWFNVDGRMFASSGAYRYVWPSEMDLMARVAGLRLRERWSGWDRAPFTAASKTQIALYEKPV
jgi:ubiquinone/menaquinone biosynthesis C-methylase UbiE